MIIIIIIIKNFSSHHIPPMIKTSNHNITQRGTQATGLGAMIGMCSLDGQHGRSGRHSTNIACSFFRYMNDDVRNHNHQRPKLKTWTREHNQLELHGYFRSNPSQKGYRKRMIEIWQEYANFLTTSQRLADQVRTIIKKDWFSDLKILEIYQKTLNLNYNTVRNTSSGVKQKHLTENELLTSENENTTLPNSAQSNNHKETLSQEQKIYLENVLRIMNCEKDNSTIIKKHRMEKTYERNGKINQILPHITTTI